jgi:RNA polymerase sigma-70 factor (ECF subfamily)
MQEGLGIGSPAMDAALTDAFEAQRPRLTRLAYRMLGSVAEAEDAVQDAWLRWT